MADISPLQHDASETVRTCPVTLQSQVRAELLAAEAQIRVHCNHLTGLLSAVCEAELRRLRQHYHQTEKHLEQMKADFSPASIEVNSTESEVPQLRLSRLRTYDIDLELCQLVRSSLSLEELPQLLSIDADAAKAVKQGQDALTSDDYRTQLAALCACEETRAVSASLLRLKFELERRTKTARVERERRIQELLTEDAKSVQRLFAEAASGHFKGTTAQLESLLDFAGPESVSLSTAKLCAAIAKRCKVTHDSMQWYYRSLTVVNKHFPTDEFTAKILSRIGAAKQAERCFEEAREKFERALILLITHHPASREVSHIHLKLCTVHCLLGSLENAEASYQAAMAVSCSSKARAVALYELGRIHFKRGECVRAKVLFEDSLRCYSAKHHSIATATHIALGRVALNEGSELQAEEHFRAALSLAAADCCSALVAAKANIALGKLLQRTHRSAEEFYQNAAAILKTRAVQLTPRIYLLLAQISIKLGDLEEAHMHLSETLQMLAAQVSSGTSAGKTWRKLGQKLAEINEHSDAVICYTRAAAIFKEAENDSELALAWSRRGESLLCLGEIEQAGESFECALRIFRTVEPFNDAVSQTYRQLGEIAQKTGDKEKARRLLECAQAINSSEALV